MDDWAVELERGAPDQAWDAFLARYRRLIFAAIRRYAQDYDDVMDVFARVCEALREDDLRRLRSYQPRSARFSTWLVTVVHRLTVDWFRHRDGRRRLAGLAEHLPPRQSRIFQLVFLDHHSHVAAFETLRADEPGLSFHHFNVELRATYRAVSEGRRGGILRALGGVVPLASENEPDQAPREPPAALAGALAGLAAEDRLMLQLYIEQELPAAEIARLLGFANAKAVYNRVYRTLATLRADLERAGLERDDP